MVVVVMVLAVVVTMVVVLKVLVYAGVVVSMAVELLVIDAWTDVVIESLSDVVTGGMVVLEFVVPKSYFVEVLSGLVVEAVVFSIGFEVVGDVNMNVSAAVMTPLEFPMSIL